MCLDYDREKDKIKSINTLNTYLFSFFVFKYKVIQKYFICEGTLIVGVVLSYNGREVFGEGTGEGQGIPIDDTPKRCGIKTVKT